jgi:hypothetical protein
MLINFKKYYPRFCYVNKNEINKKNFKIFMFKSNLSQSVRLVSLQNNSKMLYHFVQLKNYCNFNNKTRSVFRFFRLNIITLNIFIRFGLLKNLNKTSW